MIGQICQHSVKAAQLWFGLKFEIYSAQASKETFGSLCLILCVFRLVTYENFFLQKLHLILLLPAS